MADGPEEPKWYFDGEKIWWKIMRFLNLLEPDRTVMSVTKVTAWLAVLNSLHMPDSWGAHVLTGLTFIKAEARRREQRKKANEK